MSSLTYKQYLNTCLASFFAILALVACTSYTADPANIYHDPEDTALAPSKYVSSLIDSKHGLAWPNDSWNERDIKVQLIKQNNNIDCALLGSSHVMQMGTARANKPLKQSCETITNLGVSGGTLEDFMALTHILLEQNKKPNTIVYGMPPWALAFDKDKRWERYQEAYFSMRDKLDLEKISQAPKNEFQYFKNLINPEYFQRSFERLVDGTPVIATAAPTKSNIGDAYPILLPDGSLIYSRKAIKKRAKKVVPLGGKPYKLNEGTQYSQHGKEALKSLIRYAQSEGITPIILLTPYHPNVWKDNASLSVQSLIQMEETYRTLADELQIQLVGSFNPSNLNCVATEFFDFMHAMDSCLAKI